MEVQNEEIIEVEKLLLPEFCHFNEEARRVIKCFENTEILACPGSGKTTILLAKIKLISNRMPLKKGKGVCILSHTNVAVDEIKNKLGFNANKILEYPNFVGTIQSFIDRYVVFPYLCGKTKVKIQVTDDKCFAEVFWNECQKGKNRQIKFLIEKGCEIHQQFDSPIDFIKKMYLANGDLYVQGINAKKAGKGTASVKQYNQIIKDLLIDRGVIRYKDAYTYTEEALKEYGEVWNSLLSERFQFVFIDEYQDCSELQRMVIDKLFNNKKTIVQKIGDVDQAIYNNENSKESTWILSDNKISLPGTNRYGQEIADVLIKLRTGNEPILAFRGKRNIPPTLIVFNDSTRHQVIDKFIDEIKAYNLHEKFPEGPFKAVGMYKNVTGLKLKNYWENFQDLEASRALTFEGYIINIIQELRKGNIYKIEKIIRKLLCQVCYYMNIVSNDGEGPAFTVSSIKKELDDHEELDYRSKILEIVHLDNYKYETIYRYLIDMVNSILDVEQIEMPESFWQESSNDKEPLNQVNIYQGCSGIQVDLDTVYKVKGETHIATLYLETEKNRGSDLKRIMPLLENKKVKTWSELHEKSRKCVYVGWSRPSHLLCVAIQESTYIKYEKVFKDWKVIPLI